MAVLSDSIEAFLISLLNGEESPVILVQRNELANYFRCAPSQINYVLATRFSVDHGYIIESRRGGGGYVRIVRMTQGANDNMLETLLKRVGTSIDEESANAIIACLHERKLITRREALLMRSAVAKNALQLPVSAKDVLRASVLRNLLAQVFRNLEEDTRT